ncbi:MAG: DUF1669 domain-containing protein [Proteobacteria bacterium]|nr:DUF1669 domain-containing protein [Pseudomonadota bacterium]
MHPRLRLAAFLLVFPLLLANEECDQSVEEPPVADDDDGGEFPDPGDGSGTELTELAGECAPVDFLMCGVPVSGDTADWNAGATDLIDGYPVAVGNYDGPEIAYAFRPTATETVTFRFIDPNPTELNHDVFVLEAGDGTCQSANAVARGFNDVSFEVEAGATYFVVVDGFDGAAGAFEGELECTGSTDGGDIDPVEGASAEVIFSPQPYADSHLARTAELIDAAATSIDVAMYSFRDNNIQDALGRAVERGVSVRAILESGGEDKNDPEGTRSGQLEELGIEVRYVNKIMHHKFALIDGPRTDVAAAADATLITGSANWSYSAGTRYDENTAILRGDEKTILAFQQEYDHLWEHGRLIEWRDEIPAVETAPIGDDVIASAPGSESVFTSANMTTYTSSHGPTFRTTSGSGEARDALADFILSAEDSVWIASGHLRSRQITDALLDAVEANPGLQVKVYLDGQEYVSDGYFEDETESYEACVAAATTTTQSNKCEDKGLHFGWALADADITLRYKYYSYRWHYSYAIQMHHKYVIVDGERVASGSYNFSNNAEHDTMENLVFLDGTVYPELVDDFIANFDSIWATGTGPELDQLMAQVTSGEDFPIVFDSMALTHAQVTGLKDAIKANCPDINSDEYKSSPQSHHTCEL